MASEGLSLLRLFFSCSSSSSSSSVPASASCLPAPAHSVTSLFFLSWLDVVLLLLLPSQSFNRNISLLPPALLTLETSAPVP